MSVNLISFCLASTYHTSISCHPQKMENNNWSHARPIHVCVTAHFLSACKVSLQQERDIFRHSTVLHKVIEAFKTFILNVKVVVPISTKISITFLKKGTKVSRRRIPPVGVLHHPSDWVVLEDLNSNYYLPLHIAFTQLRPDITIFVTSLMLFLLS